MAEDYHFIKIGGLDVLSPLDVAAGADQQGFPADFWGKANSIHVSIGFEPGVAYLVVPRATMDALNVNELHTITWTMARGGVPQANSYSYWTICDAKAIGIDGDSKAAYLLTLRDLRCVMKKSAVINKAYNVSTPDDYGTTIGSRKYLAGTLNSGSLWTWQEMLADVWSDLPALAGSVPTLPWSPAHSPDSWRFHGVTAWEAVKMIFDATQSTLAPVPGLTSFAAVNLGIVQADVFAGLTTRLLRDERPKDADQCVFPESVTITFPTRAQTTEAIPYYAELPVYAADPAATGISGARAGSELPVRYDLVGEVDSAGTIENESDLDDAAVDIAGRIANRMAAAAQLHKVHSGVCHEIVLGTNVNEILIRDYGDGGGCVTESIGHLRTGLPNEAWSKPMRELPGSGLIGGCLAQDHPGRGNMFGIWLGTWNSAEHWWEYTEGDYSVPAIDWRYGVPYPDQGATGLFIARASDDEGTIWEVVSLDCDVPPDHSCGPGDLQ